MYVYIQKMSILVRYLNGDLEEFKNCSETKLKTWIAKSRNVSPDYIQIVQVDNNDHEMYETYVKIYMAWIDQPRLVFSVPKPSGRRIYNTEGLRWLTVCENESIILFFLKFNKIDYLKLLFRNPHPLVVSHILDNLKRHTLTHELLPFITANPADAVVDYVLNHRMFDEHIGNRWSIMNTNPQMVERVIQHYPYPSFKPFRDSEEYDIFESGCSNTNTTMIEHLWKCNQEKCMSTTAFWENPSPFAQQLAVNFYKTHLGTPQMNNSHQFLYMSSALRQCYPDTVREFIKIMDLSPVYLQMALVNHSDIMVDHLFSHPDVYLTEGNLEHGLCLNQNPRLVEYLLTHFSHTKLFPHLLANSNDRAVEESIKWFEPLIAENREVAVYNARVYDMNYNRNVEMLHFLLEKLPEVMLDTFIICETVGKMNDIQIKFV